MDNGTITGCTGANDGGVFAWDGGTFAMSGGEISDCVGPYGGAVIYNATFNVSGTARIPGKGAANVYLYQNGRFNLVGPLTGAVKIAYPDAEIGKEFGTATGKASGAENITAKNGLIGSINTSTTPHTLVWKKAPLMKVYVVENPDPTNQTQFATLEAAYSNVSRGGTIYLMKDVSLTKTFPIYDDVIIDGLDQYSIRADASAQLGDHNHLLKIDISQTAMDKGGVTLKNLTIDFN